ncbi:MAG TPA: ribosome biogenesis GTPase Der [Bacilli bacterium]|nr:ribosome biogenesis GTPase Der [Bacilli bacterium]
MRIPTVALVGKPNVGKSTLFNRLAGKRISIIEDTPGVTRDRIYSLVNHGDYKFHLIDTGGIDIGNEDFNKEIRIQAELAIDEADVIVFIIDGKEDLNANDYLIRDMLRKSNKKVIIAINKIDSKISQENMYNYYELGFDIYVPISAEQNKGIYNLLDEITKEFQDLTFIDYDENVIKFSIIGRPNVGKSSLVNALLNEERAIVSNVSGTTRDAVDTPFVYNKRDFVVIDTAGIKKQGKIYENIERYSVLRALKAIDRSDVCLIVLNVEEGIIEQDKHIAGYAIEAGKSVVIVVNKWDMATKDMNTVTKEIRNNFAFMPYAPIVFVSALTKKRIHTIMPEIIKVYDNAYKEVKTSVLNEIIEEAYRLNPSPSYKGKRLKIYYVNQVDQAPPKFLFHVNNKSLLHFSYERYIENKLRESIDLEGTPIVLQFKNRGE